MSEAPQRIWTCAHVGEYGHYYPDACEAEGEYGGTGVGYIRQDIADALAEAADALADAAEACQVTPDSKDAGARLEAALARYKQVREGGE